MKSFFATLLALLSALTACPAFAQWNWGGNQPDAEWRVLETGHFRFFFPEAASEVAARAARIAEESYASVTEIVGGAPPGRTNVTLRDFSDRSSGLAYSVWPRIEIEPYPLDRDTENVDFLRQVVIHEFTHVAMYYAVGGRKLELVRAPLALENLPDWWVEGLASALEKPHPEPAEEELVQVALRSGRPPTLHRLDTIRQGDFYDRLLVYRIGESKIRWLVKRFGTGVIADVHHAMRPIPFSFDHALRRATGMGEDEIHAAWLDDVRASYAPRPATERTFAIDVPLPRVWERPLGAAPLADGSWALTVVRDEDVWTAELVRLAPDGSVTILDPGPVHQDLAVGPDGRVAYAKRVRGPGQSFLYDLWVVDPTTRERTRLTRDQRATRPVWIAPDRVAAIAYDRGTGLGSLLLTGPGGPRTIEPPAGALLAGPPAASPGGDTLAIPALDPDAPDGHRFLLYYSLEAGTWKERVTKESPFRVIWSTDGLHALTRDGAKTRLVRLPADTGGESEPVRAGTGLFTDAARAANGEWYAVQGSGRYGSALQWWLRESAGAAGPERGAARPGVPVPETSPPAWNRTPLLTPRAGRHVPLSEPRPYRSLSEIRPRPRPSLGSIDSDGSDWEIEDLLADPVDLHSLDGSGGFRWDGDSYDVRGTYENRVWTPALFLDGSHAVNTTAALPWEEASWSAGGGLRMPVSRSSAYSRAEIGVRFSRNGLRRENEDATESTTDWAGALDFSVQRSAPRSSRAFSVEYLRATSGGDAFDRERWRATAQGNRAVIRNDWFLGAALEGLVETGSSKRVVAVASPGLDSPSSIALGDRAIVGAVDFRYPWSEDLGFAFGPFWFERLTHRIAYREGRAWQGTKSGGIVRSAETDLRLTLFSGHFIPFLGTETTTLRAGHVRELTGAENGEWFASIETSFYSERWSAILAPAQ